MSNKLYESICKIVNKKLINYENNQMDAKTLQIFLNVASSLLEYVEE